MIPKVEDTFPTLFSLIKEEMKAAEGDSKIIVFGTTANMVALCARVFEAQTHLQVFELQSRLSQNARTRATDAFKAAKSGIMFASDGMALVIPCLRWNFPPNLWQLLVEEWIFPISQASCKSASLWMPILTLTELAEQLARERMEEQ